MVTFVAWFSLGVIALYRCLILVLPDGPKEMISSPKNVIVINVAVWLAGAALPLSAFLGVTSLNTVDAS